MSRARSCELNGTGLPGRTPGPWASNARIAELANYLGLDEDVLVEGLIAAAARDAATFRAAAQAARRVRAGAPAH